MPVCPVYFGVSLLKLNSRKKGNLIINGLLGNLGLGFGGSLYLVSLFGNLGSQAHIRVIIGILCRFTKSKDHPSRVEWLEDAVGDLKPAVQGDGYRGSKRRPPCIPTKNAKHTSSEGARPGRPSVWKRV